jgi:hypothetical protein
MTIRTHCISEVMQSAIDSSSSSLLELLHTVKDCLQKGINIKKWKQVSLLDLWKKFLETCNVQCNTALICTVL